MNGNLKVDDNCCLSTHILMLKCVCVGPIGRSELD
jgi:hypothetical protein